MRTEQPERNDSACTKRTLCPSAAREPVTPQSFACWRCGKPIAATEILVWHRELFRPTKLSPFHEGCWREWVDRGRPRQFIEMRDEGYVGIKVGYPDSDFASLDGYFWWGTCPLCGRRYLRAREWLGSWGGI